MNQYGFNYFNFLFITLFTSLKFSSLMGWSESRACWRILLLGGHVIRLHALDSDHPIKLENFKLVNKSNKYEIKIVESILIHKLGPNLNDRGSSFPLSILQWTNLREFNFTFYLIIYLIFVIIIFFKCCIIFTVWQDMFFPKILFCLQLKMILS